MNDKEWELHFIEAEGSIRIFDESYDSINNEKI